MSDLTKPPGSANAVVVHLCSVQHVRPALATLIHAEFWGDVPGTSPDDLCDRLALATSPSRLPICRVGMDGDTPVGVANLIDYDDPNPRVGRPWLAGLVVVPAWRGRGLGSRLVRAVIEDAKRLGERELFLGTDGPGFYLRLGAQVQQQLRPDFWLMRFDL